MAKRKQRSATRTAFPSNVARPIFGDPRPAQQDGEVSGVAYAVVSLDLGSRTQEHYSAWLADKLMGERCQAPWCIGWASKPHHEPCGSDKDDRMQTGICVECHADRHASPPRLPVGYTLAQVRHAHEASAARNWLRYLEEVAR